jgi:hypothetical protein
MRNRSILFRTTLRPTSLSVSETNSPTLDQIRLIRSEKAVEAKQRALLRGRRVPEKIDNPQGGGSPLRLFLFKSLKENTMAHAAREKKAVDYEAKRTRDHDTIRRWAEKRGGRPTMVEGTQILRIDFDDPDGSRDENLVPASWDEFFRVFDERGLEFLYQEHTHDGHISRFNKFVYEGTDSEQD